MLWEEKRAISVLSAQNKKAQPLQRQKVALLKKLVAGVGFEPVKGHGDKNAQAIQNRAKSKQFNTLEQEPSPTSEQSCALSIHPQNESTHSKRVPGEYQNLCADLAEVIEAWDNLPSEVKGQILALIKIAKE